MGLGKAVPKVPGKWFVHLSLYAQLASTQCLTCVCIAWAGPCLVHTHVHLPVCCWLFAAGVTAKIDIEACATIRRLFRDLQLLLSLPLRGISAASSTAKVRLVESGWDTPTCS